MRYDTFKKMHDLSMMYGSQEDVTSLVKSTERVSSPCDAQDYDLPIVASEQDIMPIYLCLELTIDGKVRYEWMGSERVIKMISARGLFWYQIEML